MGNAKVTFSQQNRSAIIPTLNGIEIGTVINADWGPIVPYCLTDPSQQPIIYAPPNNAKGTSWNGAQLLSSASNILWITRAIHADAAYAGALVRFEITQPDFNTFQTPGSMPDPIISPLTTGISLAGTDSYEFPLYEAPRVYADAGFTVTNTATDSVSVVVPLLVTAAGHTFTEGDNISFGTSSSMDNSTPFFTIVSAGPVQVEVHTLTNSGNVSGAAGTEVFNYDTGAAVSFNPQIFLTADASNTNTLQVTSSDNIVNGHSISISGTVVSLISKALVNETQNTITFSTTCTVAAGTEVQLMISNDIVYRDAWLVTAIYPGARGKLIKIGTRASTNYPTNAVILDVYWQNALVESWEVTRDPFIDGYGNQLQAETVINGTSVYIKLLDNAADLTRSLPLVSNYGVWAQNANTVFLAQTSVTLLEDVVTGDQNITISAQGDITIGSRIKFSATGPEYKVLSISGDTADSGVTLAIDRPVVETTTIAQGSIVYEFESGYNVPASGVFNGVQYYLWQKTPIFTDYNIGDQYTISSNIGTILDAGCNQTLGGSDGSAITQYDVINAFNKMGNKEAYKISCFCDNGFTYPAVAQAIDALANPASGNSSPQFSHGYLSAPHSLELMNSPEAQVIQYRQGPTTPSFPTLMGIDTAYTSLFTGWIQIADTFNQTMVWVAPSVMGILTQSFVTQEYYMFTPAAGWVYGLIQGLDIAVKYDDGQRDLLVDANINPIRYQLGHGMSVWGNETLSVTPSPLQLRSVAMLLIMLKYGLNIYLQSELFRDNIAPEWSKVETAISLWIRDNLYTPGGLYDYQVSITKIITNTDIDARRMPIFIGLQPTEDIQLIPVTLGIFNKSVAISF